MGSHVGCIFPMVIACSLMDLARSQTEFNKDLVCYNLVEDVTKQQSIQATSQYTQPVVTSLP